MPTKDQQRYYDSRRKLTKEQHLAAYEMYHQPSNMPKPTIDRLAQLFNVSHYTMWRIIHTPPK